MNVGKNFHLGRRVLFELRNSFAKLLDSICERVGFRYLRREHFIRFSVESTCLADRLIHALVERISVCNADLLFFSLFSMENRPNGFTHLFRSRDDPTTMTDDTLMAKDPIQGRSTIPKGMNNPAAIGIPNRL